MTLADLLFPHRTIPDWKFEQSVFGLVSGLITDKRALGEELAGAQNLKRIPPAESAKRQRMAAELYLLLERNISEEQSRGRIPREILREKVLRRCHPERAAGNFAILFLPHYERQVKLFAMFADMAFARARELMGESEYQDYLAYLAKEEPLFAGALKNGGMLWDRVRKKVAGYTPAVQRDTLQESLKRAFGILTSRMVQKMGELRVQTMLEEVYRKYHDPLDFIEDGAKPLVVVPDNFLENQRVGLLDKSELERLLRTKSQALETTLAEVQGERLKLSELTREELEKKVEERTAELVGALKAAETARKNLEEFSSIAAHELRAPVAAIRGSINLMKSLPPGAAQQGEAQKYLLLMDHAGERLLDLVNAMLQVSRAELGTLAIEPSPVYLPDIAEEVLAGLALRFKEKKLALVKNFDQALPIVELDASLMRAVIENLLTNAVKYTPEGGSITINIQKQDPAIHLQVEDTGYGIPKALQPRIFEKMFRADNVRAKGIEGTGLGLYFVKSILEQVGGRIWFESDEDRGTTFFVTVPLSGMKRREGVKGFS